MSLRGLALENRLPEQAGIAAAAVACFPIIGRVAIVAGACLFGGAAPARLLMAQQTTSPSLHVTQGPGAATHSFWASRSRLNFGLQVAYAIEQDDPFRPSHITLLYAQPQLGIVVSNFYSRRLPLSRFEIINEGMLGSSIHPGGRLTGYVLLFRLDGKSWGRTIPFVDMGAGVLNTTLDRRAPELTGSTQFSPQAGFGIQYFFKPQRALVVEYRYLHMSNNNIQLPNFGFNSNMLTLGFRWMLRPRGTGLKDSRN